MANKLQELIKTYIGNGARAAKYHFQIKNIPGSAEERKISIMCKGAIFPSKNVTTIDFHYKGRPILIPSKVKYDQSFDVTFYLDEGHEARIIFMDWMQAFDKSYDSYYPGSGESSSSNESINTGSALTNTIRGASNDSLKMSDIAVSQLDFDLTQKTAEYNFNNCYPIAVSPITVDDSQVGAILEYTVTFAYSHFTIYKPNDGNKEYVFSKKTNEFKL